MLQTVADNDPGVIILSGEECEGHQLENIHLYIYFIVINLFCHPAVHIIHPVIFVGLSACWQPFCFVVLLSCCLLSSTAMEGKHPLHRRAVGAL